jgi:hypothetical protein
VFDSSGSMAAATDGRTKMEVAKEVLNALRRAERIGC